MKGAIEAFKEDYPLPGENFNEWEARRTTELVGTVNAAGGASAIDSFVSGDLGYEKHRNISDAKYPVSILITNELERKSEQAGISAVDQIKERLNKTYTEYTKNEIRGYYATIAVFILACIVVLTMLTWISGILVYVLVVVDVYAIVHCSAIMEGKIDRDCKAARRESLTAMRNAETYREWVKATKKIDKKYRTKTRIALARKAQKKFGPFSFGWENEGEYDIKTGKNVEWIRMEGSDVKFRREGFLLCIMQMPRKMLLLALLSLSLFSLWHSF